MRRGPSCFFPCCQEQLATQQNPTTLSPRPRCSVPSQRFARCDTKRRAPLRRSRPTLTSRAFSRNTGPLALALTLTTPGGWETGPQTMPIRASFGGSRETHKPHLSGSQCLLRSARRWSRDAVSPFWDGFTIDLICCFSLLKHPALCSKWVDPSASCEFAAQRTVQFP